VKVKMIMTRHGMTRHHMKLFINVSFSVLLARQAGWRVSGAWIACSIRPSSLVNLALRFQIEGSKTISSS